MTAEIVSTTQVKHVRVQYDGGLQGLRDLAQHMDGLCGRHKWYLLGKDISHTEDGRLERVVVIGEKI